MNRTIFCLFGPLLFSAAVEAADPDPVMDAVVRFVTEQTRGQDGRVVTEVPPLDPRTRVGECDAPEVYLPSGQRLRGRTHLGVRCVSPSSWQIFVPVTIKIFGPFLIASRKLSAGQTLDNDTWRVLEGDLATQPDDVLSAPEQAHHKKMRTGLAAGQPLRRDHLLRQHAVRQGQPVKIVVRGTGFSVSSEGLALANAHEGETVRAKNPAGQVIAGRARAGSIVEVLP